jgi:hypothetical protein
MTIAVIGALWVVINSIWFAKKLPKGVIKEKIRIKTTAEDVFKFELSKNILIIRAIGILWIRIP